MIDLVTLMSLDSKEEGAVSDIDVRVLAKTSGSNSARIVNHGVDGTATVPLLMYPQYRATADNGVEMPLSKNESGLIQVQIPEGFSGEVLVAFVAPPLWRCAEAVSVGTLLILISIVAVNIKRKLTRI